MFPSLALNKEIPAEIFARINLSFCRNLEFRIRIISKKRRNMTAKPAFLLAKSNVILKMS